MWRCSIQKAAIGHLCCSWGSRRDAPYPGSIDGGAKLLNCNYFGATSMGRALKEVEQACLLSQVAAAPIQNRSLELLDADAVISKNDVQS